jgi:hypothetical protein
MRSLSFHFGLSDKPKAYGAGKSNHTNILYNIMFTNPHAFTKECKTTKSYTLILPIHSPHQAQIQNAFDALVMRNRAKTKPQLTDPFVARFVLDSDKTEFDITLNPERHDGKQVNVETCLWRKIRQFSNHVLSFLEIDSDGFDQCTDPCTEYATPTFLIYLWYWFNIV